MEHWQQVQLIKNMPELLKCTTCNIQLLAELECEGVIGDIDADNIMAGTTEQSKNVSLYNILLSRRNGYYALMKALYKTRQKRACKLLFMIPVEQIGCLQVSFLQNCMGAEKLLSINHLKAIQDWLQTCVSLDDYFEYYERIFRQKEILQLVRDTIPPPISYYIPRRLFGQTCINPGLFGEPCSDVFVFKDIHRVQLRKFIKSQEIESSTRQLLENKLTVRFILLDSVTDWKMIYNLRLKNPIHLIKYCETTATFVLEASVGASTVLNQYIHHPDTVECFSEEQFINDTLQNDVKSVCICDSPGMGKSILLANLARRASQMYPDRIVAYLQMRELMKIAYAKSTPKLAILKHISTSPLAKQILLQLTQTTTVEFMLFLDGLDDVEETKQSCMITFLHNVLKTMPEAIIYVASRLMLRRKLQETLEVLAYSIEPFSYTSQCKFLTKIWFQTIPNLCKAKLHEFAEACLQNINAQLAEYDKNLIGIPLFCKYVAETNANKAIAYATEINTKSMKKSEYALMFQIFKSFIEGHLGNTECNFDCMHNLHIGISQCNTLCKIRSYHVWQALQSVCSEPIEGSLLRVSQFDSLSTHNIFSPGFLVQVDKRNCSNVYFFHKTVAEYLVAEYFSTVFLKPPLLGIFSKTLQSRYIAQLAFDEVFAPDDFGSYPVCSLRQNTLASFLNTFITEHQSYTISVSAKISASSHDFLRTLVACLRYNYDSLLQIFIHATATTSKEVILYLQKFMQKYKDTVIMVLEVAAKYCSVQTIQIICEFFLTHFKFDFIKLCDDLKYSAPVYAAIKRADLQVVKYFIGKVSLENKGLLYCCLEDTYSNVDELVEKRLEIAQLLLSKCSSLLCEPWKRHASPLFASNLHLDAIEFLVKSGSDFRQCDDRNFTVFQLAVAYMSQEHFLELSKFLYNQSSGWDMFEGENWVNFFCQLDNNENEFNTRKLVNTLNILAKKETLGIEVKHTGADETISEKENEPIVIEVMKLLLRRKFYQQYEIGFKALFRVAVVEGNTEVVDLLISTDKNLLEIECKGKQTPLLLAAQNAHIETTKLLLKREANIFAVNDLDENILHIVAKLGDVIFFEQFLNLLKCELQIRVYRHYINFRSDVSKERPKSLSDLFNRKERDSLQTPLHYVMRFLNLSVKPLDLFFSVAKRHAFDIQLYINEIDAQENTALHYALEQKQDLEIVKYLIDHGADWKIKNGFGCNVAHICAQFELVDHLKYFLELGCNINEVDCQGNNALHCTFSKYYDGQSIDTLSEIIQVLVAAGANVESRNGEGIKAINIARKRSFPLEIRGLLAKEASHLPRTL